MVRVGRVLCAALGVHVGFEDEVVLVLVDFGGAVVRVRARARVRASWSGGERSVRV